MLQEVKLLERLELACEEQLAATFENYCSLAEDSPSGLAENGAPTPEQPAPALRPAVGLCSELQPFLPSLKAGFTCLETTFEQQCWTVRCAVKSAELSLAGTIGLTPPCPVHLLILA